MKNLILAVSFGLFFTSLLAAQTNPGPFSRGDVFAATDSGVVLRYSPSGVLLQRLDTGSGTFATGMAFDAAGNLYVTNFGANQIVVFDNNGNRKGTFGSGFDSDPESIAFDRNGNAYVGQADGAHAILEFSPNGTLIRSIPAAGDDRGSDWIAIAPDQKSIYYTSEGPNVKRIDLTTGAQLPDFASSGTEQFASRFLSDGTLLVADSTDVLRYDARGSVIQRYTQFPNVQSLFALNLDPDATTFWTSDLSTAQIYRVNIATGAIVTTIDATKNGAQGIGGLTVYGEIALAGPLQVTGVCPVPAATRGSPYSGFTVNISGGTPPYSIVQNLPAGLSYNSTTGLVSGTPTVSGNNLPISISVTDSGTAPTPRVYSCSINIAGSGTTNPLALQGSCPATSFQPGAKISIPIQIAGGTGPFAIAFSGPTWLAVPVMAPGTNPQFSVTGVAPATTGSFPISVTVTDANGNTATFNCSVTVATLTLTGVCPSTAYLPGAGVSVPLNVSGGTGPYTLTYSGPSWLSVPSTFSGGSFAVSGVIPYSVTGTFPFSVTVKDSAGNTLTFNCAIAIVAPRLQITQACPASPTPAGTAIIQLLYSSGGVGPVDWAVYVGSLPPGLQLNNGRIFGTPTTPGTYSFTLSASTDTQFDQVTCQLVVSAPTLQFTSGCPANGVQGVPYGPFTLAAVGGGGTSTYVFGTTGNLPPGLALTGATLAGTPTASGVYNFNFQVTSGTATALSPSCSVTVAPPPLDIQGACPADVRVGSGLSASFTGVGGTKPYSFTFSGPSWLTQTGGTVTGTPQASNVGSASFSISISDAAQATKSKSCLFNVLPQLPQITSACPAVTQHAQTTLTVPLVAILGTPPYSWTYDGGEPDLTLTSLSDPASLTGTLTKQGTFTFSVGLMDQSGSAAAPLNCTINVGAPLPPALTLTPTGTCPASPLTFGSSLPSLGFTAGGGTPPYTWTVTPSDLFTISPAMGVTATVTGTLTRSGTIPLTVTVTDSAGVTQSFSCSSLTVSPFSPPTLAIVTSTVTQDPVSLSISLSQAEPFPVMGTATLTFTSQATHPSTGVGPATFSAGSSPLTFTIPANMTSYAISMIQKGGEAGVIHVAITNLTGAGQSIPGPAPFDITIPKTPPVFTANDVQINSTSSGFNIVIAGSSSTRDMTGGSLTFNGSSTIDGGTVDLGSLGIAKLFDDWYTNPSRSMNLTTFQQLTLPVSITGDKSKINSITITLTNSAGSTSVTKNVS